MEGSDSRLSDLAEPAFWLLGELTAMTGEVRECGLKQRVKNDPEGRSRIVQINQQSYCVLPKCTEMGLTFILPTTSSACPHAPPTSTAHTL